MKIKNCLRFFCLSLTLFFSHQALSDSFKDHYKVGNGSTYIMTNKDGTANNNVSIYITSVERDNLGVEYFIESQNSFLPSSLWQQFNLKKDKVNGGLKITEGYILDAYGKFPETLEKEHLKGQTLGAQTSDFLFSDFATINKHLINKEEVSVPAGKLKTNRYKIESNGQTIEFWIAQDRSPLTLVKLISKGKKSAQNYQLLLATLVKNVKAKIDPSKAKPLSKKMRSALSKTLK